MNNIVLSTRNIDDFINDVSNEVVRKMGGIAVARHEVETIEKPVDIDKAAEFLNLKKPTIYTKCSKGELPYMKRNNRLYFLISELSDYLKDGRNKSQEEIEAEADAYLLSKNKGLNDGK